MNISSRNKELAKNTALFGISSFASKVLVFLMVPLYTSVFTTEEYGISSLINITTALLMPLLTMCISDAVLRFCLDNDSNIKEVISYGVKLTLLGTIVAAMVAYPLNLVLKLGIYAVFIPIQFATNSFYNLLQKMGRGVNKIKECAVAGVMQTFIVVGLNLLFLLVFELGILGYILSYIIAQLATAIYLAVKCNLKSYIQKVNLRSNKKYLQYSAPLVPNNLSWWLIDSASSYIIKIFVGTAAVGIYSAAMRVPTIVTVISGIFIEAWLLSVIKVYDDADGKHYIAVGYRMYKSTMVFITLVLITLAQPLARILLRGDFYEGWQYIPIMLCMALLGGLSGFMGTVFSAEKKTKLYFITALWGGLLATGLSIAYAGRFGLYAVTIACTLGNLLTWMWREVAANKYVRFDVSYSRNAIDIICLATMSVLAMKELYSYEIIVFAIFGLNNFKDFKVTVVKILAMIKR